MAQFICTISISITFKYLFFYQIELQRGKMYLQKLAPGEDQDHPAHPLIWVFAGCTCQQVHFLTVLAHLLRPSQGFWGTGEYGNSFQGKKGTKSLKLKETRKQRQFWGTGNIENEDFDFGEQGKMTIFSGEQGNRYHLGGPLYYYFFLKGFIRVSKRYSIRKGFPFCFPF